MSRSERVAQQLGMSQGAAQNRLRKIILFSFARRLKEDICFKCGKQIETVEELSIEHKQPWENRSSLLFWDLENIAFSHVACNVPHVHHGAPWRKIEAPPGQSWCFDCSSFKAEEDFDKNAVRWNGLHSKCKSCKSKQNALRDRRVSEL